MKYECFEDDWAILTMSERFSGEKWAKPGFSTPILTNFANFLTSRFAVVRIRLDCRCDMFYFNAVL